MPAFPVGRGGIMLNGAAAPAAAIINNGPGLLYLYRNSAVSTFAYDTVIGPSGSFQWPGGELWAASDSSTTVNVLAGLSAFDSGTTTVAGTVNVAAGGSGSSLAIRASRYQTDSLGNPTIPVPVGTVAGDYMFLVFSSGQPLSLSGGWTFLDDLSSSSSATMHVYYRVYVNGDGGANFSSFSGNNPMGCGIISFKGNVVPTRRAFTTGISGTSLIPTGQLSKNSFAIAVRRTSGVWSWASSINGGPPDPAPALSTMGGSGGSTGVGFAQFVANWTGPAGYNLSNTNGDNAAVYEFAGA